MGQGPVQAAHDEAGAARFDSGPGRSEGREVESSGGHVSRDGTNGGARVERGPERAGRDLATSGRGERGGRHSQAGGRRGLGDGEAIGRFASRPGATPDTPTLMGARPDKAAKAASKREDVHEKPAVNERLAKHVAQPSAAASPESIRAADEGEADAEEGERV